MLFRQSGGGVNRSFVEQERLLGVGGRGVAARCGAFPRSGMAGREVAAAQGGL